MSSSSALSSYSLLYIGATWCTPCRTVKPLATVIAHKYGVPLTLVDYDEMEDEVVKEGVKKLPTIRVVSEDTGAVVLEITTNHAEALEAWLRTNVRVKADEDF